MSSIPPRPPDVFVLREDGRVQVGVDDGVVIDGLNPTESAALLALVRASVQPDPDLWAALGRLPRERIDALLEVLPPGALGGSASPPAALTDAWLVVDGRGEVGEAIVDLARAAGVGRVDTGGYAADAALALVESGGERRPDLVVLLGAAPLQASAGAPWQAHGIPHLPVSGRGAAACVGPLVVPGVSSCLVCHDHTRATHDPQWPRVLALGPIGSTEPLHLDPRAGVLAAALAAVVATGWLDGSAPMAGISAEVALPWPTVVHRHWPTHPGCGCTPARPRQPGPVHTASIETGRIAG